MTLFLDPRLGVWLFLIAQAFEPLSEGFHTWMQAISLVQACGSTIVLVIVYYVEKRRDARRPPPPPPEPLWKQFLKWL